MAFKFTEKERKIDGKDPTQGKIYRFFDWVWKLFVINTCTLVCCLGIVTILPSLIAGFRTIKDCYEEDETHYFKKFFYNFRFCFRDSILIGIIVLLCFGILLYAYIYYSELIDALNSQTGYGGYVTMYSIFLSCIMIFFLILTIFFIHLPISITYFHLRFFDKFRFTFYMTFKHFGITLCLFLLVSINLMLMLVWPPYIFLFSFSLPLFAMYLLSRKPYWTVQNNMVYEEYEEDEYDMKGVKQNREDYEDDKKGILESEKSLEELNNKIMGGKIDD